ncbi:MAG: ribosome silencing factor [Acidobacteriota bacterium]
MEESVERTSPRSPRWDLFDPEHTVPDRLVSIAEAALDRNAREGVVLDLRGLSDATDYFVVLSGDSDVHTRAIAESISERLEDDHEETPAGVEGRSAGRWILLDFIDIVVHVFLPRVREFYQLERLWGDAPRAPLGDRVSPS